MDSSLGFTGLGQQGSNPLKGTAFVLASTDSGKRILVPVNLPIGADSLQLSEAGPSRKKGVFRASIDVLKGIGKGAVNTVSGLLSVKGLLMTAATIGVSALVGPAIIPFLVAAGVFTGGLQIARGASSGNWEGVGEGIFTLGATMAGARFAPKVARNAAGEELILSGSARAAVQESRPGFLRGMFEGTWQQLRLVMGKKVINTSNPNTSTHIYKLASESGRNNWHTLKQQGVTGRESRMRFDAVVDNVVKGNARLKQALTDTLGTDGKVTLNPTRTQSVNPQVRQAVQQFAKEQPIAWNLSNTAESAGVLGSNIAGTTKGVMSE